MTEESKIQKKIITLLESRSYSCLKISRSNKDGIPDVLAYSKVKFNLWVEVKTKTGKLSPLQEFRIKELRAVGQTVIVAYGYDDFLTKYRILWG